MWTASWRVQYGTWDERDCSQTPHAEDDDIRERRHGGQCDERLRLTDLFFSCLNVCVGYDVKLELSASVHLISEMYHAMPNPFAAHPSSIDDST